MKDNDMLEHRKTLRLRWFEPWPGLSRSRKPVDAHVTISATIDDCVNMQRMSEAKSHPKQRSKDKELLFHFIATRYAELVRDENWLKLTNNDKSKVGSRTELMQNVSDLDLNDAKKRYHGNE